MESKASVAGDIFDAFLAKLKSQEFYGTIELHFEKGKIVLVKTHEALLEKDVKKLIEA